MIIALALAAVILLFAGYAYQANIIAPFILLPWGLRSVIEYFRGEPIQLTWYTVSSDATNGERKLWLGLSVLILVVGVVVIIRNVL